MHIPLLFIISLSEMVSKISSKSYLHNNRRKVIHFSFTFYIFFHLVSWWFFFFFFHRHKFGLFKVYLNTTFWKVFPNFSNPQGRFFLKFSIIPTGWNAHLTSWVVCAFFLKWIANLLATRDLFNISMNLLFLRSGTINKVHFCLL